ncbi:MAG: FecR domain-containing protein [Saprospiraceae bacterium]|nr:FecR domain-containing protein [Saprospiraceae bacterium]MDW8483548.1 FecR domain-containing protein [Saprospiraceae bacterium]
MLSTELLLLLQRQWTGEITPEEKERLEAALKNSPQWAAEAEVYQRIWEKAIYPSGRVIEIDLDEEFARLTSRIEAESIRAESPVVGRRSFWRAHRWKVAAAVACIGAVVWLLEQRRTSTSEIVEIRAATERQIVALPDGSKVSLRQGGALRYHANTFNKRERNLELEGDAFFIVNYNPQKPFWIQTPTGAIIEVLGTQFAVRSSPYETSVLVNEGIVRFWPEGKGPQKQSALLQSLQKACWRGKKIEIFSLPNFNELVALTHFLDFEDDPLSEVVDALEEYYHAEIVIQLPAMRSCSHSGHYNLDALTLRQILRGLCSAYGFRLDSIDATHCVLLGGTCPNSK